MGKPLLELFEENSYEIYRKYSSKDGSKEEPLVEIKPDDPNIVSPPLGERYEAGGTIATRHSERMQAFEKIGRGKLFADRQAWLQRENTFSQTRAWDSDIVSKQFADPVTHQQRHIPQSGDFGKKIDSTGLLQSETREKIKEAVKQKLRSDKGSLLLRDDDTRGFFEEKTDSLRDFIRDASRGLLDFLISPLTRWLDRQGIIEGPSSQVLAERAQRPELSFIGDGSKRASTYFDYLKEKYHYDNDFRDTLLRMVTVNRLRDSLGKPSPKKSGNLTAYVSYDNRTSYKDFVEFLKNNYRMERDPRNAVMRQHKDFRRKIRYFKDLTQIMEDGIITKEDIPYGYDTDYVDLIFKSISEQPTLDGGTRDKWIDVRFRALLEDVKETVNPSYVEKTYISRIEKFYTYNTVTRDLKLVVNLQAWSELELQNIWAKVNYLSSLAYPQGYRDGYPTPTIFKLTLGNIYVRKPCILQNLTYIYHDDKTSWDIHEQLPVSIQVTANVRLLDDAAHTHGRVAYRSRVGRRLDPSARSNLYGTGTAGSIGQGSSIFDSLRGLFGG